MAVMANDNETGARGPWRPGSEPQESSPQGPAPQGPAPHDHGRSDPVRPEPTERFQSPQFPNQQFPNQQYPNQQYPSGPGAPTSTWQRPSPQPGGYGSYGHSAGPQPGHPVAAAAAPYTLAPTGQTTEARSKDSRARGLLTAGLVAAMLVSGGIGGIVGATIAGGGSDSVLSMPVNTDQPTNPAPDGTVEAVAEKVKPSVVSIEVAGRSAAGEGSGVVLSRDGLIVTNNHVVDLARAGGEIQVTFSDGRTAPAKVVGTDPATDIAVIRADDAGELTPITLGTSSSLRVGQAVAAVGSPLGLSNTVTTGIVSALERPVRAGGSKSDQSTVIDAIQTDAAVNPGNSGGALVNMNGELIGINSAIASLGGSQGESGSIGLGFAIPVDQARRIADQLIKQGFATRAVLGVAVTDPPRGVGALVRQVEPDGAAGRAGIPENVVITRFGERRIEDGDALVAAVRSRNPGDVVSVTYADPESNQEKSVDVTLGEVR